MLRIMPIGALWATQRTRLWPHLQTLLGLLLLSSTALGADQGQPGDTAFKDLLVRWNRTLDFSEQAVAQPGVGKRQLEPLLENISVLRESALEVREHAQEQRANQRRLLDALGPAPEEGESPETADIAAKRRAINDEMARHDSQIKQSNVVLARADSLLQQIADVQYGALSRILSKRSPSPLSTRVITAGLTQIPDRINDVAQTVLSGRDQQQFMRDGTNAIAALLAVIAGIFALTIAVRYWLAGRYVRGSKLEQPDGNRRFIAALVETGVRVLVPASAVLVIGVFVMYAVAWNQEVTSITAMIVFSAVQFLLITGLSSAVLAPRHPAWRISRFTDQAATYLDRALWWFATAAFLFHIVVAVIVPDAAEPIRLHRIPDTTAPRELSALVGISGVIVLGVLMLNVLRSRNWRFVHVDPDSQTRSERSPSATSRFIMQAAKLGLLVSITAGAIGYLNFGLFVSQRTLWTLSLIVLARLVHGLVAGGVRVATAADTSLGLWVRQRLGLDDAGGDRLVFWIVLFVDIMLFAAVFMISLLIWGMAWADVRPMFSGLVYGTQIGGYSFSLVNVGIALLVFVLLLVGLRLFQRFLSNRILVQTRLDIGVRDALTSGVGYVGIFLAALFTFSMLGLKLSELAIIFGALSVGIGFGLQHVVNNFVSGLVLLIQRPIKAGDWIVVGNQQGYVKQVNVITTQIQTFDNASLIVPNSTLVTSEVLNWMHKSKLGRVVIAVGVSYDSDPEQVRDILLQCAERNPEVLSRPAPHVIFSEFGNSSLDFELRFYIRDVDRRLRTASDMRYTIWKAFDEAGVEIPFPQQDIHIRDIKGADEWSKTDATPMAQAPGEIKQNVARIRRSQPESSQGESEDQREAKD